MDQAEGLVGEGPVPSPKTCGAVEIRLLASYDCFRKHPPGVTAVGFKNGCFKDLLPLSVPRNPTLGEEQAPFGFAMRKG